MLAHPELLQPPRPYQLASEFVLFDIQRVYDYLTTFTFQRKVNTVGQVSLKHQLYSIGRTHAGKAVLVCFDPHPCQWVFYEDTESMLTEEGAKRSRFVAEGTVVLSNSGFSLGIPKILRLSGCANDGVAVFVEMSNEIEPEFLYYRLLGLTEYLRKVVAADGDQPNLNTKRIGRIPLYIPSLEEQRQIISIACSPPTRKSVVSKSSAATSSMTGPTKLCSGC